MKSVDGEAFLSPGPEGIGEGAVTERSKAIAKEEVTREQIRSKNMLMAMWQGGGSGGN